MTAPKKPTLAPEIASVPVDDAARQRWAWFLPGLLTSRDERGLRELQFLHDLIVPSLTPADVESEAASILADCNGKVRLHLKPGIRATLILADLARQARPVSDRVVEALAATLGLTRLHTDKRLPGVTWIDDDTSIKTLRFLADRTASTGDERDAGLALYDSVLWYRERGKITPGPVLNGLAALFGLLDPTTGELSYEALANATHRPEVDALLKVAAFVEQVEQRADAGYRRALGRLAEEFGTPRALRDTEEARIADAQAVVSAVRAGDSIRRTPLDRLVARVPLHVLLENATPDEPDEEFRQALERVQRPSAPPSIRTIEDATGVPRETVNRLLKKGVVGDVREQRRHQRVATALIVEGLKALRTNAFDRLNGRDTRLRQLASDDREQVLDSATVVVDDEGYEQTPAYQEWRQQNPLVHHDARPLRERPLNQVERRKLSEELDRIQPQREQPDDVTASDRAGLLDSVRLRRLQALGERLEEALRRLSETSTEPDEVRAAIALLGEIKTVATVKAGRRR
jgi:hypothetical protein